jgi:hypothetical protein
MNAFECKSNKTTGFTKTSTTTRMRPHDHDRQFDQHQVTTRRFAINRGREAFLGARSLTELNDRVQSPCPLSYIHDTLNGDNIANLYKSSPRPYLSAASQRGVFHHPLAGYSLSQDFPTEVTSTFPAHKHLFTHDSPILLYIMPSTSLHLAPFSTTYSPCTSIGKYSMVLKSYFSIWPAHISPTYILFIHLSTPRNCVQLLLFIPQQRCEAGVACSADGPLFS